jgi:hypothetical protein
LATIWVLSFMFPSVGMAQSGTSQTSQATQATSQTKPTTADELKALREKADQGDAQAQKMLADAYVTPTRTDSSGRGGTGLSAGRKPQAVGRIVPSAFSPRPSADKGQK